MDSAIPQSFTGGAARAETSLEARAGEDGGVMSTLTDEQLKTVERDTRGEEWYLCDDKAFATSPEELAEAILALRAELAAAKEENDSHAEWAKRFAADPANGAIMDLQQQLAQRDAQLAAAKAQLPLHRCEGCGEYVHEIAGSWGHTRSEHANDPPCREGMHSNCPIPVHCGPIHLVTPEQLAQRDAEIARLRAAARSVTDNPNQFTLDALDAALGAERNSQRDHVDKVLDKINSDDFRDGDEP
jgi:hypothetical protein